MFNTLKEVHDSKIFHGVKKNEAEAYELCKEELENHGKQQVVIWFLKEKDGKLSEKFLGYRRDFEVPSSILARPFKKNLLHEPDEWMREMDFVLNKNPHQLYVLARAEVLDNFKYCCLKNLIERIDELQIPVTEKEELKKLVRLFKDLLRYGLNTRPNLIL